MREIKFRLWDKKNNIMYDWDIAIGFLMEYVRDTAKIYDDFVIMQYTGFKDKNGREVYEGDIVEVVSNIPGTEYLEIKGVVVFKECIYYIEDKINEKMINLWNEGVDVEVIGNIYENPELLKGE